MKTSRITEREMGLTIRSLISTIEFPTLDTMNPAFCGSTRNITLTSM
ncbi:MAG: hypothetical protein L6R30_24925 [Thermoanaerobaculia bacterium]|nr:hypothetical protein [Thermoanaerobaculia bacterium]